LAVQPIVDPAAARLNEFAGRDHRGMAENRDQVALASGLDPQHAEAVLGIVKGDAIDESGQRLGWRARFRRLHHPCKMNKKNSTCCRVERSRLARNPASTRATWGGEWQPGST